MLSEHFFIGVRNLAKESNNIFLFLIPFRQIGFTDINKLFIEGIADIGCGLIG